MEPTQDHRAKGCYEQILLENQPWVQIYNDIYEELKWLKPAKFRRR